MKKYYTFFIILFCSVSNAQIIDSQIPFLRPNCLKLMSPTISPKNMFHHLLVETGRATIDVSALQSGQYFVKANTNKGFTATTFIKR